MRDKVSILKKFLTVEILLPYKGFIMLDVIQWNVCRKAVGSYRCDIFARTAVLAVGISPCSYGFSMEKQLFWPISCICLTKWSFKIIADLDRNILKIV